MNRIFLIVFLIFLGCNKDKAPDTTFQGDVVLGSQKEVDDFGEKGYKIIEGNLEIRHRSP